MYFLYRSADFYRLRQLLCRLFYFPDRKNSSRQFSPESAPPAAARCGQFGVRRLAAAFPSSNPHPSRGSAARLMAIEAALLRWLCKSLSPSDATLTNCGVCVASKGLTHHLSHLDATYKKHRGYPRCPLVKSVLSASRRMKSPTIARGLSRI